MTTQKTKKKKRKNSKMHILGTNTCKHTGEEPLQIGDISVRFAAGRSITPQALAASQILMPLNGSLPWGGWSWGAAKLVISCALQDHGGVPANWATFLKETVIPYAEKYTLIAWCVGSHGRTGCLIASLAALKLPEVADPIAWAREHHCKRAVESKAQAEAVFALRGETLPAIYEEEFMPKVFTSFGYTDYGDHHWYEGKRYTHDVKFCSCFDCEVDRATDPKFYTRMRLTPCQCNNFKYCADDRAEYATRKGAVSAPVTGAFDRPTPTDRYSSEVIKGAPGKCLGSWMCLCDLCQAEDVEDKEHTEPASKCQCLQCITIMKLEARGDMKFLHEIGPRHKEDCLCTECWIVEKGHAQFCCCHQCIYVNVQPTELEDPTDGASITAIAR